MIIPLVDLFFSSQQLRQKKIPVNIFLPIVKLIWHFSLKC